MKAKSKKALMILLLMLGCAAMVFGVGAAGAETTASDWKATGMAWANPTDTFDINSGYSVGGDFTNFESSLSNDAYAAVRDNLLIDGMTIPKYNAAHNGNINVHFLNSLIRFGCYTKQNTTLMLPVGTTMTVKAGFSPAKKNGSSWVVDTGAVAQSTVTYVLTGPMGSGIWKKMADGEIYQVNVDKATVSVVNGGTLQLKGWASEAYTETPTAVAWASSDETVATVSDAGLVTAKKMGTAKITASIDEMSAACDVTVTTSVSLDKSSSDLIKGKTFQLTATVANFDDKTVSWTSSLESVATVSETGLVTAVGAGNATVTATSATGDTASCQITVAGDTTISLDKTELNVKMGNKKTAITATVNDDSDVAWTVDKKGIVSLSKTTGASISVTPTGIGTVTLTATANGKTATCTITVKSTISLNQTVVHLEKGKTFVLSSTVNPADSEVTWTSSDSKIATVENGTVTAVADGKVTITATTIDGVAVTCTVTVYTAKDFQINSLTIADENACIQVNYDFSFAGNYTNFEGKAKDSAYGFFYDNFLINGLTVSQYNAANGMNLNLHFFQKYLAVYFYNTAGQKIAVPAGTTVEFKAGLSPAMKDGDNWVRAHYTLPVTVKYIYLEDGTWSKTAEAGSTISGESISVMDKENEDYFEFTITMDLLVMAGGSKRPELDDSALNKILINGKTVAEINSANPDGGVEIYYSYKNIVIDVYRSAKMNGSPLIDEKGHTTSVTVAAGFVTKTDFEVGEDYTKFYYGDMDWWSDEYQGRPESDQKMVVKEVSALEADNNGDVGFTVTFTENVFNPTVHVNGVCAWQITTPYGDLIDGQLTTGVKAAVLYGIKVDGKTVYDIMYNSGLSGVTNQSTAIMVHFDGKNSLRLTFQHGNEITPDVTKTHTFELLGDSFYSNTGATLAGDVYMTFNPSTKVWTDEYAITGIKLDRETASLVAGHETTLTADVIAGIKADKTIVWSSSDKTIATVENGVVKALKTGTATITATAADGQTAECVVTVAKDETLIESIELDRKTLELQVGSDATLKATVTGGTQIDGTVVWSSSDEAIATVENGVVKALKSGTVTITAKAADGKEATCTVTVTEKPEKGCRGGIGSTGSFGGGAAALMLAGVVVFAVSRKKRVSSK